MKNNKKTKEKEKEYVRIGSIKYWHFFITLKIYLFVMILAIVNVANLNEKYLYLLDYLDGYFKLLKPAMIVMIGIIIYDIIRYLIYLFKK